ncbi:hypothetical protein A3SK_0121425 [Pseudomonas amygdali pv. tabaci str. 6605]|uniref:hypothetical protein n=1 Tax=Pseudomonas amygdali TaxID=47877 RepID=UPI00037A5546|nr:hypothetical protein [Pseudomonas amygdali]KEZ25372.1 hypothetical protein A3SK_0121425 [Pseudomonas amygdali pv. tabaci str. 6605]
MFDQKKIDAIAERDATIECFNITLTQNTLNFPLIFSGPGCLFFDESKNLKVKLYSTSTTSESIEVTSFFWSDHIGLIPEERYFELEAEDAHGKNLEKYTRPSAAGSRYISLRLSIRANTY